PKKALAKPFKLMAIPRVELMTSSVASLRTKTGLQAIDSAVLTREPLPWSGRGQNRRLQLVGKVGGPGRDRTDDLSHAMEARSQLRHRPTAAITLFSLSGRKSSNPIHARQV